MHALRQFFPQAEVRGTAHHLAHGLYAAVASGYEQAAVLIADSLGATATASIGVYKATGPGARYRIIETIGDPASLGYAYGAVTEHLGWRRGDEEGTVMALAALGDPARLRAGMSRAIAPTGTGFALDPRMFPLPILRHGWPRAPRAPARRPL